ncbi:MAG: ferrous iron transport protein B [Ruminococcus sp.]|nr:ferrous iron transport protein B [Ruminococcus sp.]
MNKITIALAGNPNSGKTTLFNALTGSNQYVGNWPGVTVEKKEGSYKKDSDVTITDLPGIYSLSPYTLEEVVAREYLLNEQVDVILNIVDGTNLERNLYLTTQFMELGIPVVVAINMMDVVEKNGDQINIEELSKKLKCHVIPISAIKGDSILEACDIAIEEAKHGRLIPQHMFSGEVEHALAHIEEACVHSMDDDRQRFYAVKLFERDEKVLKLLNLDQSVIDHIEKDIVHVEEHFDDDAEAIITNERYDFIEKLMKTAYVRKSDKKLTASERIDKVLTNRVLALPIFALIMWGVYTLSIGTIGAWTVDFMNETLFGEWIIPTVETFLIDINCASWLTSLVCDGIIGGVGAVLGFVPQMFILFFLLSILESVGYMSRVAFIMDRILRKIGLSGKSFIPMLVASGCGVPGIMASRTIEQDRDRKMTIMTTGFIPCGAKMPIVALIAAELFGGGAWVATLAYFIGISAVITSGVILKKTKAFAGEAAPFVMELPSYHMPLIGNVLRTTWERGWSFVKRAGSVILLASIAIWILMSLSFDGGFHYITEESGGNSVLEYIGGIIAYIFVPLGFGNWQSAVATILGFMAKEEVAGALASIAELSRRHGDIAAPRNRDRELLPVRMPRAIQRFHFLNLRHHCPGVFQKFRALFGWRGALAGSLENDDSQRILQLLDGLAQTGLTDIKIIRRLRDGAGPLHLDGIFQMLRIHAILLL